MQAEKNRVTQVKAYRDTFETEHGQKVLNDLMRMCNMLTPSHSLTEDYHNTMYREGQRSVALYILHKLKTDISGLLALINKGDKNG